MEEELMALLLNAAEVTRHVAASAIHWNLAPQGTHPPYIVMQVISRLTDYHMRGASGYAASRVQIDCYAEKFATVADVTRAVKTLLSGYSGGSIQGIFIESERNLPASDASETALLFRISIDFKILHGDS